MMYYFLIFYQFHELDFDRFSTGFPCLSEKSYIWKSSKQERQISPLPSEIYIHLPTPYIY